MHFIDLACAKEFILNKMAGKEECACSSCFETTEMRKIKKKKESILDVHMHFKPTETFNTGYIKGEASRLRRTKSSKTTFEENITLFKQRLRNRGYLDNLIDKTLSEVNLRKRMSALQNKLKTRKNILRFVMEYRPSVSNPKQFRWVNTGTIIRDGDRKRGVRASPCVEPKKKI